MASTKSNNPGCLGSIFALFGNKPKAAQPETVKEEAFPEDPLPYRLRDDFLSPAERNFFQVLQSMTGGKLTICTKVSLADLFFVVKPNINKGALNRINRKHVDFLICEPGTMRPLFGIELDDQSHNRADRVERDAFVEEVFAVAGLPLLRIPVQASYSTVELGQLFKQAFQQRSATSESTSSIPAEPQAAQQEGDQTASTHNPPLCPKCGIPLVLRTARTGSQAGKAFYGCSNYPRCRVVLPAE